MLTHHKLKVYEKALALGAFPEVLSASWGKRHAVGEHFHKFPQPMPGDARRSRRGILRIFAPGA